MKNDPSQTMKVALQSLLTATASSKQQQQASLSSSSFPVDERDRLAVNRCFARGNEEEYEGPIKDSGLYRALDGLYQALSRDDTVRHFVVDQWSPQTEDALWLSLPKWAAQCHASSSSSSSQQKSRCMVARIQPVVTTVRSLERNVFGQAFDGSGWRVLHGNGPRGTAMVTASKGKGGVQCVFSDQPRHVESTGRLLASNFAEDVILRVFRVAPRPALFDSIANVVKNAGQQKNDNMFDIWIRHHEVPEGMLALGSFRHVLMGSKSQQQEQHSLLELLTDVDLASNDSDSDEDIISSHDLVEASFTVSSLMRPCTMSPKGGGVSIKMSPSDMYSRDRLSPVNADKTARQSEFMVTPPPCTKAAKHDGAVTPSMATPEGSPETTHPRSTLENPEQETATAEAFSPNAFSQQALVEAEASTAASVSPVTPAVPAMNVSDAKVVVKPSKVFLQASAPVVKKSGAESQKEASDSNAPTVDTPPLVSTEENISNESSADASPSKGIAEKSAVVIESDDCPATAVDSLPCGATKENGSEHKESTEDTFPEKAAPKSPHNVKKNPGVAAAAPIAATLVEHDDTENEHSNAAAPSPSSTPKKTAGSKPKRVARSPRSSSRCTACQEVKPKTDFSKAQLKKGKKQRCKNCVDSGSTEERYPKMVF